MDSSTELLALCANHQVQTTDLDAGEFTEPKDMPIVAAATHSLQEMTDHDVTRKWEHLLKEKYAPRFPEAEGMRAHDWLKLLDDGQMAKLCRSVGAVETAIDQGAISPTQPDLLVNSPENQERVHGAYLQLRADVMKARSELKELMAAMWSPQ